MEQELVGEQEVDMLTEAILESSGYWIVSVAITILMAAGTTALGVMLYKYLAKRCERWEHIKQVLKGQDKKSLLEENKEIDDFGKTIWGTILLKYAKYLK